jgi:putative oxidoreductase
MAVGTTPDNRYYVPALGSVWTSLEWLAWPLVRIVTGALLIPHGLQKFGMGGSLSGTAQFFGKMGLEPAWGLALYIALLEVVGGILLVIGLFTRPVALLLAGFMAVATFYVHMANGFFWTNRGFEYPLMWLVLAVAVLIRGGGELSVDRRLAREF